MIFFVCSPAPNFDYDTKRILTVKPSSRCLVATLMCLFVCTGADVNLAQESGEAQVLWTTKPVRVQPSKQALQRLPSKRETSAFPDVTFIPKSVRVEDSTRFSAKGKTFKLAFVDPVPPQLVCKDVVGKRWSCGLSSRMALRNLIAGKQIACKSLSVTGEGIDTVVCETRFGETLAASLLRSGAVTPIKPVSEDLLEAANFAIETRSGIWSDEEFYRDYKASEGAQ